jgi:hypothetical protein
VFASPDEQWPAVASAAAGPFPHGWIEWFETPQPKE